MNPARILVFAVAIAAGGVAAYLAATSDPPASPAQVVQTTRATEVLVAAVDIPVGAPATAKELRWQSWPSDGTTNGMITRTARPQAVQEFTGAIARTTLLQGEPIRRERLIKTDKGGFMSALLPTGAARHRHHHRQSRRQFRRRLHPAQRPGRRHPHLPRRRRFQAARRGRDSRARRCCATSASSRSARTSRSAMARRSWSARPRRSSSIRARSRLVLLAQKAGPALARAAQPAGHFESRRPDRRRAKTRQLTIVRYGTASQR